MTTSTKPIADLLSEKADLTKEVGAAKSQIEKLRNELANLAKTLDAQSELLVLYRQPACDCVPFETYKSLSWAIPKNRESEARLQADLQKQERRLKETQTAISLLDAAISVARAEDARMGKVIPLRTAHARRPSHFAVNA